MSKTTILIVEDEAIVAADLAGKLQAARLRGGRDRRGRRRRPSHWPSVSDRTSC